MPVCLSHHGFVRLLQHLKRYVCPRSLGSDHVSGDLRVARAKALGQRVDPPPSEYGGDPSPGPGVPRRQVCPKSEGVASFVHLAPLAHTWLLRSLFWEDSVVSGGALRGARAGVGRWLERVLFWDEALYPHIFLWEWESGSSVALLPSVASSAQGPSGFCLLSGVTGFGLRFGGVGLCLGLGLGLALGVALALALGLGLTLPLPLPLNLTLGP